MLAAVVCRPRNCPRSMQRFLICDDFDSVTLSFVYGEENYLVETGVN